MNAMYRCECDHDQEENDKKRKTIQLRAMRVSFIFWLTAECSLQVLQERWPDISQLLYSYPIKAGETFLKNKLGWVAILESTTPKQQLITINGDYFTFAKG